MSVPLYLGDEVSAAGYRLAGVRVRTPAPGEATAALAEACAQAPLVLVSSAVAAAIGERALRAALSALAPLVVVVPDLEGDIPVPDLAARLRAQLGLEA
ncbi:MAG TPA: V-type ATP synthase subunit F [Caldimonas sp.]|nr:V-type ATP synthase subunit F [Caldimonas sp.]